MTARGEAANRTGTAGRRAQTPPEARPLVAPEVAPVVPSGATRAAHDAAVGRLLASYGAIAPGSPVRLAKTTTNLFRPRSAARSGLDVTGLDGVLAVDPVARTADVQGMCTYERLVAATLEHGLMPLVVPQLRTITLGGAVTGLGIEATSFRHGLPHESVLEMDVLTGAGDLVTATATNQHAELFGAMPNSYGSLGYSTRLRIELQPIGPVVSTRILRFRDLDAAVATIGGVCADTAYEGVPVDALDGVMFDRDDVRLVLARFGGDPRDGWSSDEPAVSDYTGQAVYYRSLRERDADRLSAEGYLWRWDTDWFWCSEAFGAQHPVVRRVWPRRWRRSDVYRRLLALDHRYGLADRLEALPGRPPRERLVQDVELPLERTAEFLRWYAEHVPMRPVWLCPLRLREPAGPGSARRWPLYPLEPGRVYVNAGFWGTVPVPPGARAADAPTNRLVEDAVERLGGHKSLYSDVYYDRARFDRLYGGAAYAHAKDRYDPDHRLPGLYEKVTAR